MSTSCERGCTTQYVLVLLIALSTIPGLASLGSSSGRSFNTISSELRGGGTSGTMNPKITPDGMVGDDIGSVAANDDPTDSDAPRPLDEPGSTPN